MKLPTPREIAEATPDISEHEEFIAEDAARAAYLAVAKALREECCYAGRLTREIRRKNVTYTSIYMLIEQAAAAKGDPK